MYETLMLTLRGFFGGTLLTVSLAVVDVERTALWMQFLYLGVLAYATCLLLAVRRGRLAAA